MGHLPVSKQALVEFSMNTYDLVKDVVDDEQAIVDKVLEYTKERLKAEMSPVRHAVTGQVGMAVPGEAMMYAMMTQTMDGCVQVISSALWAHAGFPQVSLGHKYAAALLVTEAPPDIIDQVQPPFPAFLIEIPDGLLLVNDPYTKELDPIRRVLVQKQYNTKVPQKWTWAYTALSAKGTSLYRYGVLAAELLPPWIEENLLSGDRTRSNDEDSRTFELTDQDKKVTALIGRLIINVCLAFSDPTTVGTREPKERRAGNKHGHSVKMRKTPEPVLRVYEIGKEIKHDFREHVREFVAGKRRKLSVQTYVHGFWRMQAHGPRLSLRRLTWIEPFWRGPEDAPIATRPHRMGTE